MISSVTIEPLTAPGVPTVAEWLSAPAINCWLTTEWRGRTIDPVIISMTMRNKKNRLYLSRHAGIPCGIVALADIDLTDKVAMVWYVLGAPEMRGRGVTTVALRQLVTTAFDELGFESLYAWIIDDNVPSRRVLEKAGFREAGRLRGAVCRDDEQRDRQYFDLVKQDCRL